MLAEGQRLQGKFRFTLRSIVASNSRWVTSDDGSNSAVQADAGIKCPLCRQFAEGFAPLKAG